MRQYPVPPFSFTVSVTGGIQLPSAGIPVYVDLSIERTEVSILPSTLINKCVGFTVYRIDGSPTYTIHIINWDNSTSNFTNVDISEKDSFVWLMRDIKITNNAQANTGILFVFYKQFE